MTKLSNLIGNIPVIDSYLRCSNAYKMKPKAYQLNETQEISVINQNHNGQQIASDKALLTKFWDWFDGSATVDDKGRPIVFYHGSPYKFDKFKTKNTFLSTSANFANDYAAAKSFEQGLDLAPNIYDCYLKIKNPLNIGSKTGINAVLTAVKGKSIEAYWRKISEWDLSVALEGKTPYNYLDNFDKAKVGEYINPRNSTSTSWMVSNDNYLIVHKTDNKIYAIRVKEYPLYAPYRGYENAPKNLDEVTLVSNNITNNMPQNALMHKPTNGVYISVPREEAQAIDNQTRLENLGKTLNVQRLNYNAEGEASIRIPFKIHGSFITGVDKFTDEQEIGGFFDVEAIIYTDKENAKLAEADDTWDLIETIRIDGEKFFDFLHQIGFDSIYIMENSVLNVCVFDNTDIKLTSDFRIQKDSSSEDYNDFLKTHKPLTEASNPVQTNLINQNHLGNPIAKDEESLKRFWKWFGKSATVDQKGRPFVFYHGSAYTFSKFDAGQIIGQLEGDNAVFFSTSKKFAEEFGSDRVAYQDALEAGDEDAREGSLNIPSDEDDYIDKEHLYECYLRVKNPFNPKNKNNVNLFIQWVKKNIPADVLSNYNINFDLLKSSLSGTYSMNYTNDINSLNLYDVIKIPAYADSKPVETVLRNQNQNNQIDKSLWQSGFHTYAQVFHKGKRSALAFSISFVDLKHLIELAKNYSKNNEFEINLKVSPAMVADRVMRSGVKFSDAVSKKVPASFPVEISWGTRVKKRELLTVPVNVVVWSITEKDNARTKSYDSIWEEMESLIIGEDYSFVGILKALGFDSFYTYEESYLNLAVFDPKNIKSIDNVGKWGRGKNIYESVLCERLIGDAGSAKLIDEPDYDKAVEKLIAAYNAGETDCYIKTDIEFQDNHEISANPQEIDVPDEQRQHKTRKLTIILGLDDIQAKDEARKVSDLMEKHFDEYKEYDGSGLRHVESHIDSIRDYLESLPEEEKEAIGYETLKTKERGVMLAWLKALPNLLKKSALQLKERNSYRQKTTFVYGSFILVIGLEDKPTNPFKARAKAYQNDFNYIVTFYKATPNYIDKIISLHEKYMDYKLAVEQGGVQPDAERKFVHLSSLVKKQIGVETVVLKRKITK